MSATHYAKAKSLRLLRRSSEDMAMWNSAPVPGRPSGEGQKSTDIVPRPGPQNHNLATREKLDFSWIIRRHNKELVNAIKLQKPNRLSQFLCSIKNWRLSSTGVGGKSRQNGELKASQSKWDREDKENSFRISIAELYRIRLRKLQCKLVDHVWHMKRYGTEPDSWEDDLQAFRECC